MKAIKKTRLTIPAKEALRDAGAVVNRDRLVNGQGAYTYTVSRLSALPIGLVITSTPCQNGAEVISIRCDYEPPYPGEIVSVTDYPQG